MKRKSKKNLAGRDSFFVIGRSVEGMGVEVGFPILLFTRNFALFCLKTPRAFGIIY